MKDIIEIRTNGIYHQGEGEFNLIPTLEIILIYVDGRTYKLAKDRTLKAEANILEVRFIATPKMLTELISDLQLHQQKMDTIRKNAEQMNAMVKHLKTENPT